MFDFLKTMTFMNTLVLAFFIVGLLFIFLLLRMIKMIIDQQIDDQMEKMIPFKSIRRKIKVKVIWR